jgi:hypothetical protein
MKTVINVGIAFALMLSVAPAMAEETETFQAFSKMAAGERARLTALADEQLAAIEGEGADFSQYAFNYAAVYQANVNSSSFSDVDQRNSVHLSQSIGQSIVDADPGKAIQRPAPARARVPATPPGLQRGRVSATPPAAQRALVSARLPSQ